MNWDDQAATFDDQPDHGLRDPVVRAAWAARLAAWLPGAPADVFDAGCGTGSLTLLLAEQGHRPVGVDRSPEMVRRARRKLAEAGHDPEITVGDAAEPPGHFDVVLCRHLLWTFPDPAATLRGWIASLRPGGRLVLVEGRWGDSGLTAAEVAGTLRPMVREIVVEPLPDPALWGRPIDDERYAVVALP
ncbi:class I SAM-dependent methyltransferase [Herbidospora sp. NBRC 101105]|uniref:class I SAM-dependent methyltransferase n=1 Tax=Herbidospora sp. NBRC 101105 TaxID=3032195 RepID=UPI0024A0F31B|nr:class I SAM-dependent methyltransferase [Herbidospora sp. NBRC 101105]GLX92428.1 SAM-dependent methyltransferase [Herbidospora sp. NBRC 101105]